MSPFTIGLVGLVGLLFLLALRVPIAFALGIAGVVGIIALDGFPVGLYSLATYPFAFFKNWVLVAIPLFIIMGYLASAAGVTANAFQTAYKWLGQLPGGLAMASIAACAAFAATSGSSVATAGMVGAVAIPEMRKYGYDTKLASGAAAAGGLLGILIPPSIPLVIYGFLANESVAKLLLAGFIPGIMTALIFVVGIAIWVKIDPALAPKSPDRYGWKDRIRSLPNIWGVFVLFLVVILGIYTGIFTSTEAAAMGAAVGLIMAFCKNFKKLGVLSQTFADAGRATGMIFGICVGASLFNQFLILSGLPGVTSSFVTDLNVPPIMIVIAILAIYIPLGMFLDTISMLIITIPIFAPIITAIGFSPILFGILVVKMEEVSLLTPPVGLNVYVIKGVAQDVPLSDIFKGTMPFLFMEFIAIAVLLLFPIITLWLPNTMISY